MKAEPRTLPEEYKGSDIAETSMVKEEVQDDMVIRND